MRTGDGSINSCGRCTEKQEQNKIIFRQTTSTQYGNSTNKILHDINLGKSRVSKRKFQRL